MTIKQILKDYSQKLKGQSSSPVLDIELLLTKILNRPKEYLYEYPEKKINPAQITKFKQLFERRAKGEPIAYILGHKEFYNLDFKVNKNILIPRPETELLVEETIKFISNLNAQISILDIGVGSGAIIIALAKNLKQGRFYGTDISSKALALAKQNAKNNKVKIKFLKGNLLKPLQAEIQNLKSSLIITANLPYLDKKEENLLPSSDTRGLKFEPKMAWDGGPDGLKYFRKFFKQIEHFKLKPRAIFLEIGHKQAAAITKLISPTLAHYSILIKKDLCGFDRLLIITK